MSVAAIGVLSMVLTLALVKNTPNGPAAPAHTTSIRETLASVKTVWLRPGTRLGFFTHMGTQFSVTVFALMWGVPYLTVAQGLSSGAAGGLLTISVVAAISSGIVIGIFTGRVPHRRSRLVLGIIVANALAWTVVLALPHRAPLWLLVVLIVVISVGGPGSMVGFDFARTFNPSATLGTAQGMVNMGGFVASLLVMQAMGLILDAAGDFSFESFRLAWTVQYAIWVLAVVGILITRRKARRLMRLEEERMLLEELRSCAGDATATRSLATAGRRAPVGLLDGRDQFALAHRRATRNIQPPGDFHEVLLRCVGVDALGRLALRVGAAAARPGIGRPLLGFGLPVVADLLEAVLERVVGDPVRTFTFAVLLRPPNRAPWRTSAAPWRGDLRSVLGSSLFLACAALRRLRHRGAPPSTTRVGSRRSRHHVHACRFLDPAAQPGAQPRTAPYCGLTRTGCG